MAPPRAQLFRLIATIFLLGAVVGIFAANAYAAYWDFAGNLAQGSGYYEGNPLPPPNTWTIRLSRESCGTKMELNRRSGGFFIVPAPMGCSTSIWSNGYPTDSYAGAMCYNLDGPTMWVNCRVDQFV
jgi:hypothetical protein